MQSSMLTAEAEIVTAVGGGIDEESLLGQQHPPCSISLERRSLLSGIMSPSSTTTASTTSQVAVQISKLKRDELSERI